jgi:enterobacteria phage integrase
MFENLMPRLIDCPAMVILAQPMTHGQRKMPRKLPLFVECWRDRHKKVRVYFRKGKGPRIPLPDNIGSDDFNAAYQAALAGQIAAKRERRVQDKPGTIAALIRSYLRSADYVHLRDTTKIGYSSRIEMLRIRHGHRTVSGMTRAGIVTHIMQPYADRPGAALAMLKMLRVLIRHAIEIGWLTHDPSLGIKRPKTQEIRSWTEDEIATFENRWPIGAKQRLAFALQLYTGQRRSDVHRMTWADVNGNSIRVVQQKTGRKLAIPLHQDLLTVLATTERKQVTIINTEYGKPFTVDGFSQWMRDAIAAAGLPLECQPHGLRKAAGRRLAEAGCTPHEIMAVLGHKTLAEAERYTRDVDQLRLAGAAITKLEGRKKNRVAQTASSEFGKISNKKGRTK